jgi:hypothetical protein
MLQGQWVGQFQSQATGFLTVNIDALADSFLVVAYVVPDMPNLPISVVRFRTSDKASSFKVRTANMSPLHPRTAAPVEWEAIKSDFPPDVQMSKHADVDGRLIDNALHLSWTTDIGLVGSAVLPRSQADQPSMLKARQLNWKGYKQHIATLDGRRELFRGQSKAWRLRTTFHRSGRANLERFILEDIPQLHKRLSAQTRHLFDLESPKQQGAFYSLVQHHGYPTPLLDWTLSPYVAAFFAYRGVDKERAKKAKRGDKVRIFTFNLEKWERLQQTLAVVLPRLHVSVADFLAIENERMIPQQGVSLLTNADDVENYVMGVETLLTEKYLDAIDLPVRERGVVMRELRYMGITAGSMFPGIDGACEELKEQNFG